MDYLKLLTGLKKEFFAANKARYGRMNIIAKILLTIIFIPLRIGFFFSRLFYWFTWFFFKCLATPVDYLQSWLNKQQEGVHPAAQAVLYFCCIPTIFTQQVLLAYNAFSFFFQWFGLMLSAYIMTLGTVRWQPVISDAKFDEENEQSNRGDDKNRPQFTCPNCNGTIYQGDPICKSCGQQFNW